MVAIIEKNEFENRFRNFANKIGLILKRIPQNSGKKVYDFRVETPFGTKDIENLFIEVTSEGIIPPKSAKRIRSKETKIISVFHRTTEDALKYALEHQKEIPSLYNSTKVATMLVFYSTRVSLGFDISIRESINTGQIDFIKNTKEFWKLKKQYFNNLGEAFYKSNFDFIVLLDSYVFDKEVVCALYWNDKYLNTSFLNVLLNKLESYLIKETDISQNK